MKVSEDIVDSFVFARDMRPEMREQLKIDLTRTIMPPGRDILHPGETVNGVYLFRSDAIRVYYINPDGREGTLYWIEPGESCFTSSLRCRTISDALRMSASPREAPNVDAMESSRASSSR